MPSVTIQVSDLYSGRRTKDLMRLLREMSELVAKHLGVPGTKAELHFSEVRVVYLEVRDRLLRNSNEVHIEIVANNYPERQEIARKGIEAIGEEVTEILGDISFGIYLQLVEGYWVERSGPL